MATIKNYIVKHNHIFDKLVVFDEAVYDDLPKKLKNSVNLIVAVKTAKNEDAENYDLFIELLDLIDDVTEGRFEFFIINDQTTNGSLIYDIKEGEIVYDESV